MSSYYILVHFAVVLSKKGRKGGMQNCEIFMRNKNLRDKMTNFPNPFILLVITFFVFFWAREREGFNNPAIWLVPRAGGIFSSGPPQWAESVVFIYFRDRITGALFTLPYTINQHKSICIHL